MTTPESDHHHEAPAEPGGHDEFNRLLADHQRFIRGLIVSLGVPRQDAADVAQNCNLHIINHAADFELGTNFRAWVASIVRYRCLGYFRDRGRRPFLDLSEEALDSLQQTYVDNFNPLNSRLEGLNICLSKLNPSDRQLITDFHALGESVKSVAEKRRQSYPALRKRLSRLRAMLRQCLDSLR